MQLQDLLVYISIFVLGLYAGPLITPIIHYLPKLTVFWLIRDLHEMNEGKMPSEFSDKYEILPECNTCITCANNNKNKYRLELLNYLSQRGLCTECLLAKCKRNSLIEILCGVSTLLVFLHAGCSIKVVPELLFSYCMVSIFFMDIQHKIIPDFMIVPLTWAGLMLSLFNLHDLTVEQSLMGAIAGYMSLWGISKIASLLARTDEIAKGDLKLMAAWGSWFGLTVVPHALLLSFILATMGIIVSNKQKEIAFSPYIIGGFVISILINNF